MLEPVLWLRDWKTNSHSVGPRLLTSPSEKVSLRANEVNILLIIGCSLHDPSVFVQRKRMGIKLNLLHVQNVVVRYDHVEPPVRTGSQS